MGYIAVKGGAEAIANAAHYLKYLQKGDKSTPIGVDQIQEQLYLAVDRVMGEGALYAPALAALALKQSAGDTLEAAFMVRAYRTTLPRLEYSLPADTARMNIIRRISAAFKEIPGGHVFGAAILDCSTDGVRRCNQSFLHYGLILSSCYY